MRTAKIADENSTCLLKPEACLCSAPFESQYFGASAQPCKKVTCGSCAREVVIESIPDYEKSSMPEASLVASLTSAEPQIQLGKNLSIFDKHVSASRPFMSSGSKALSAVTSAVCSDHVWCLERHAGYELGLLIMNNYFMKKLIALPSDTKKFFAFKWPTSPFSPLL